MELPHSLWSQPSPAPIQAGRASFPAHPGLRHQPSTFCLGQGIHEVIETDFHKARPGQPMAMVSQGKPQELYFSLPSFPVNSLSQRISLGPLALLLLLWLKEKTFTIVPLPQPAGAE